MPWRRGRSDGSSDTGEFPDDGPVPGRDYEPFRVEDIADSDQQAWQAERVAQAEELAGLLPGNARLMSRRYRPDAFDLSVASLRVLDDFVGELGTKRVDDEALNSLVNQSAAYLYEVARRRYGGAYVSGDDADPIVFMVVANGGSAQVTLPGLSKIRGRLRDPADNLQFYFAGIAGYLRDGRSGVLT
jgi:hypothetical protein